MTATTAASAAYIVAALLFILSLAGLSKHETAKAGNAFGIAGMAIALVATIGLATRSISGDRHRAAGRRHGHRRGRSASGGPRRVEMTGMPELIAILHSFVGLAAVLVGWNGYLSVEANRDEQTEVAGNLLGIHSAEVVIGVFIGAVTFTGSIVAFLKLSGRIKSNPLMLPAHNALNLGALVAFAVLTVVFVIEPEPAACSPPSPLIALALGWHLVASIGGGDMPVVVSMLNSYSGWAAAASGFLLGNDLLIITGALVGSSGAYLSYIMCKAMNRSFISVIAGGFGNEGSAAADDRDYGEHTEITAEDDRRPAQGRARRSSSRRATAWRSPRRSTPSPSSPATCATRASTCASASTRSPAGCPAT